MLTLSGITPVLATCFMEDESCDDESLCRQIDACIAAGSAAVCGPAFGSEFYKLTDAERYHFIDVLIEHTKKRVPVIAVPNSGSVRSTIEMARFAESRGADCLMIAAPRAVPLPGSSLIEYYSAVCAAVTVPIMLQDADWNGAGLPVELFVALAEEHANFRFAKLEAALPGTKCAAIGSCTKEQVGVVYGFGGIAMLDGLAHGACAFMPGAACVEVYARVYSLFKAGKESGGICAVLSSAPISVLCTSAYRANYPDGQTGAGAQRSHFKQPYAQAHNRVGFQIRRANG